MTPLIEASAKGHLDIVKTLLAHGADVNSPGMVHGNAVCASASEKQEEIVKFLIDCNADVNDLGGQHHDTPLLAVTSN